MSNIKGRTPFGDMRLWIIQDNDYSDLRTANGCDKFLDLPATITDAEEIKKLAKMIGIPEEHIYHFHASNKKDLNKYYTDLKKEYQRLLKDMDNVFLLVYCSGHGVSSNSKQVYVLNQSSDATFNIEYKLRLLSDKFDNFCHIFAIYDVCNTDLSTLPELCAVRGKAEVMDLNVTSGDSSDPQDCPYFHISAARPGGVAAADGGFAAKCLKFAMNEAKKDPQGLIEFPRAWASKFR